MASHQADVRSPLPVFQRHVARRLMYRMGLLWSFGNALFSSSLVLNLCCTLGVLRGSLTSLIFLMPWLTGILRTLVPVVFYRLQKPRRFCILAYVVQAVFLIGLVAAANVDFSTLVQTPTAEPSVFHLPADVLVQTGVILLCWFLANLCEMSAYLVLTAWQGEIFPARTRGRFFGCLSCWMLAGEVVAIAVLVLMAWLFGNPKWNGTPVVYRQMVSVNLLLGVFFCLSSLFFLHRIPECPLQSSEDGTHSKTSLLSLLWQRVKGLFEPFADRRFIPLACYGAYCALVTQIEQSSQFLILYTLLSSAALSFMPQAFRSVIKLGQLVLSGRVGKRIDRFGAVPVMLVSQLIVACGPLFYVLAGSGYGWWWLWGAQIFWIAYVGINIGLPQIQLQIAKPHESISWLASYGLVCSVFACIGLLLGGVIHDRWSSVPGFYPTLFTCSFFARLVSAVFLVWLLTSWRRWQKKVNDEHEGSSDTDA